MCNLNTAIRVDAKRYKIPNKQLFILHELHHQENGNRKPRNLADLLDTII